MVKRASIFPIAAAMIGLVSCQLPKEDGEAALSPTPQQVEPRVYTDTARNQGVYVTETGETVDIVSVEDGLTVRCVEATDIVVLRGSGQARAAAGQSDVRALVFGRRDDGRSGVWQVRGDNSIQPLDPPEASPCTSPSSTPPDSDARGGAMRGPFGWEYSIVDQVEGPDGEVMVVGIAENARGFRIWRWKIEAGTTVGVYWLLRPRGTGGYRYHTLARVIGTLRTRPGADVDPCVDRRPGGMGERMWRILSGLRLFFLGWYDTYLTAIVDDSLAWDPVKAAYTVDGTDEKGADATATIGSDGKVTIEPREVPPPPPNNGGTEPYTNVVLQTYHPADGVAIDTRLYLYDEAGELKLFKNTFFGPDTLIYAVDGATVPRGIYYAKVDLALNAVGGSYALRVLVNADTAALPAFTYATSAPTSDGYEVDDGAVLPDATGAITATLTAGQSLARRLDSPTDVDWFVLDLR